MQKLAHDVQVLLAEHSNGSPRIFAEISSMVEFGQLYNSHANIGNDAEELKGQMSLDNVILIMHSSGVSYSQILPIVKAKFRIF